MTTTNRRRVGFAAAIALFGLTLWLAGAARETLAGEHARSGPAERGGSAVRADGRGGVKLRKLGDFDSPVYLAAAPGAAKLLFVVERDGRIVVLRDGNRAGVFLDISGRVASGGERGLLSVAFDPRYERNRRFYVYYTDRNGDIVVDHFRRSPKSPVRALPSSRKKIIAIRHRDASNHNGGTVSFGPDGKLYLATGDGGGGGDPNENAQDRRSLLGKLLRIIPRPRTKRGYKVPKGNPFRGRKGRPEIFAVGLRNPFRFSFDRRKNTIAIGDVGQSSLEEVNFLRLKKARRANFGWDAFEGRSRHDTPGDDEAKVSASQHDPPMLDYGRSAGNCSVTGGLLVRDKAHKSLRGRYLYADFCAGQLRSFKPRLRRNRAKGDRALGLGVSSPVAFAEDRKRHVYIVSLDGGVFRLAPND